MKRTKIASALAKTSNYIDMKHVDENVKDKLFPQFKKKMSSYKEAKNTVTVMQSYLNELVRSPRCNRSST